MGHIANHRCAGCQRREAVTDRIYWQQKGQPCLWSHCSLTQPVLFSSLCLSRTYCFPERQNRNWNEGKRWDRRVEDEYRMSAGASVLLLNRTFIWPVTFPCSGIVCYTRSVFVGHARTPADTSLPHAALMHCVVSHTRCCFPCPCDCLFALQYTH